MRSPALIVILIFVCCAGCQNAKAQSATAQSEWRLELFGGGNMGNLSPNGSLGYAATLSPVIEVGINKSLGKDWSWDIRAEFIQRSIHSYVLPPQGYRDPDKLILDSSNVSFVQELNYFQFPISIRYTLHTGWFHPFVFAGVAPGFFLSGYNHLKFWDSSYYGGGIRSTDTTINEKGAVNSFQLSLLAGVGMSFDLTPKLSILAEVCYEGGMLNISNGSVQQAANGSSDPYYLPEFTPFYSNDLTTTDLHFELGIAIAL
jgi:hypothetical protein